MNEKGNIPQFEVQQGAGHAVLTGAAATFIAWDTEVFDPYNMHVAGANTLTIPESGLWWFSFRIFLASVNPAGPAWQRNVHLQKNGSIFKTVIQLFGWAGFNFGVEDSSGVHARYNKGDTVELSYFQNSGANLSVTGDFCGVWVSR